MPRPRLDSVGLRAARAALASPQRRRAGVWVALACAVLMAAAATALCSVVLLGGWSPQASAPVAGVREALKR